MTLVVNLKYHANLFLVIINQGMIYSYRKYMYEKNIIPTKSKDNVKAMQFLRSEFTIIFIDNIGADP